MKFTNPAVDPVRARQERKARKREEQKLNSNFKGLKREIKDELKSEKRVTKARIRATTPLIDVLDLIDSRREALRGIEASTDNIIVALRRRLVSAEKLVSSRTRERDSANAAHKSKCQALTQSKAALQKLIENEKSVKALLFKRVQELEAKLLKYQNAATVSTNGTKPQS